MRKILLTSSGLTPELSETFLKLIETKPAETKIGFIATASDDDRNPWYVLKDRTSFEALGFTNIIEVDLKRKDDLAKLDDCHIIFVAGGNTFYLLKWVRESKFDLKLKELLLLGKMYIGASAGSMVLGTSIETASVGAGADVNKTGIEDLRGLRQVPFMIAPHIVDADLPAYDAFAKKAALRPIVGLEDGQAVLCIGDRYKLLGPGKPHTWNSKLFR